MKKQIPISKLTMLKRASAVLAIFVFSLIPTLPASSVSNPKADYVASNSAQVQWQSGEGTASQVEYSTDPNFATSVITPLDSAIVTSHYVALTGLLPDTTYYYRIRNGSAVDATVYTFKSLPSVPSTWPAKKGIGSTPIINFSEDEKVVSISYKNKTDDQVNNFTFYRPVVSDWNYVPQGKVYWVDGTSGSDTSQGTKDSPLKTITNAVARAQAGDIINQFTTKTTFYAA